MTRWSKDGDLQYVYGVNIVKESIKMKRKLLLKNTHLHTQAHTSNELWGVYIVSYIMP